MSNPVVILANKYPNEFDQNINVFTQQTAWTLSDLGYECIVICPAAINLNLTNRKLPFKTLETTEKGNEVMVFRPHYISLGQRPGPANRLRVNFTVSHYVSAVLEFMDKEKIVPSLLFGEFLCPSGVAAAIIGEKLGCPSYFQHGEALYFGDKYFGNDNLRQKLLCSINGVVAVSGQNRDYLLDAGIVPPERIGVFPNGCRTDRFFKRDRIQAREKFGIDKESFVVGCVGSFDERKGILRLQSAVDSIEGVQFACAGKGHLIPTSDNCIFSQPVNNADLPWFLSALDAFVLPTYNEGCCTAIVEAICCGLPIISSDRSFNYEICGEDNSILVDPDDISEISSAILKLKDNSELQAKLSAGSERRASNLDLLVRYASISKFINETSDNAMDKAKKNINTKQ